MDDKEVSGNRLGIAALVVTVLVTTGGMVYRAGTLTHQVDQLTAEVHGMRASLNDLRSRVERLEVVAAISAERWRNIPDPLNPRRDE